MAYLPDLRFRCLCVQSADRAQGRSAARIAFNDLTDLLYIYITSVAMSVDSVILHHACADYLFVDVPANANSILQSLRCAFRLAQCHGYNIIIMTLPLGFISSRSE